jgi:hypothetical protein
MFQALSKADAFRPIQRSRTLIHPSKPDAATIQGQADTSDTTFGFYNADAILRTFL